MPLHGVQESEPTLILLRLETQIRNAVIASDHVKIDKIVDQLCNDYAFAVHQPHARNGGLIGLAAASIALGPVSILSMLTIPKLIFRLGSCSLSPEDCSSSPSMLRRH